METEIQGNDFVNLTNRFHVALLLFNNKSKFGKNKKVAHELLGECVTDVVTTIIIDHR